MSIKRQRGQGLLVMVMVLTVISTGVAMYALEQTRMSQRNAIDFKRTSDVLSILHASAQYLQNIYQNEANCDPYAFNMRINSMNNRVYNAALRQQPLINPTDASAGNYRISITTISPQPPLSQNLIQPIGSNAAGATPTPYVTLGYGPQDLTVTYTVVPFASTRGALGNTKYRQSVTLINTCSRISETSLGPLPSIVLGSVVDPPNYNGTFAAAVQDTSTTGFVANGICGTVPRGGIDTNKPVLDVQDLQVYSNYVRSGVTVGVLGAPGPLDISCADTNRDGILNELDVGIVEKTLKGYLYFSAPSFE
jgi:hypothetical protein